MTDIIQSLKTDYQNFPKHQTFSLYAENVHFKDPMNEFSGLERYRSMIGFIDRWFAQPHLELHDIQKRDGATPLHKEDRHIRTDWTLSWTTPLPWKPRISISGWSELTLDKNGLIIFHIDYWHCSRLDVLKQHLPSLFKT